VCSRDDHLKGFGLTCTHICPLIMNVNYRVPVCLLCLAFGPKAFIIFFLIFFFFFYYGSNMAQFPLPRLIAIAGLLSPDRPNTSANP